MVEESSATPLVADALHGSVPVVAVRKHIHNHIGWAGAIPRWEQGWRETRIRYMDGRWRCARPCRAGCITSLRGYTRSCTCLVVLTKHGLKASVGLSSPLARDDAGAHICARLQALVVVAWSTAHR